MRVDRLLKLADYLDQVHKDRPQEFNISFFNLPKSDCSTVACAIGHACHMKEFNEDGLSFWDADFPICPQYITRDGRIYTDWDAVDKFFEIDNKVSWFLFSGHSYGDDMYLVTASDVAKRIREFITSEEGVSKDA